MFALGGNMTIEGLHFLAPGLERNDGTLILPGYDPTYDMQEHPHTLLLTGAPDSLEEVGNLRFQTVAAGPNGEGDKLIMVGRWGNYIEFGSGDDYQVGVVDEEGETEYRTVDRVGDEAYCSGGSRTILRRTEDGWVDESDGLEGGSLIEAVAGFSDAELYGFGWSGEIWMRQDGAWRAVESPRTDRLLQAAAVVGDRVFVAGQHGVVLEGRGDEWVEHPSADADIWSVCEYGGIPYFSSISGVFRLLDGELQKMDTSALATTTYLFVGPSGLWSIGGGTIGLFDGDAWRCVHQS